MSMFSPLDAAECLDFPYIRHGFFGPTLAPAFPPDVTAIRLKQIHSAKAVFADKQTPDKSIQADGMVTTDSNLALCIYTADCVPVLLADPKAKVIGACHAGWRGAVSGVIESTLALMYQKGAQASRIHAAIGPAIQQSSYQVDSPVYKAAQTAYSQSRAFFTPDAQSADHWLFDVPGLVQFRLKTAGVSLIWKSRIDTYQNPHYASFRRATHQQKSTDPRQISTIWLKGD